MSDHTWALQAMFKYRLQVDFSRQEITCRGYTNSWYWNNDVTSFYTALQIAIFEIEKTQ